MNWKSERGSSLIELLVGSLIGLIAIGALITVQMTGYRSQQGDAERSEAQSEAAIALDRLSQDVRMASAVTISSEPSRLTLTVRGQQVIYELDGSAVIRSEAGVRRVVAHRVQQLAFHREGAGGTIRIEWTAQLPDGSTCQLITRASPRIGSSGTSP